MTQSNDPVREAAYAVVESVSEGYGSWESKVAIDELRSALALPTPIRPDAEQVRVQERLLIRGNTLGGVVAAALSIIADGGDVSADQLVGLRDDLWSWAADVRAVASEEAP